jgi:conjugative transfer region protein TrbK
MRRLLSRSDLFAAWDRRVVRRTLLALSVGALLCLVAALLAVKEGQDLRGGSAPPLVTHPADPLVAEFTRCQALGQDGARDAGCLAAWAENRRRFLGVDRRPAAPNPQTQPSLAEVR